MKDYNICLSIGGSDDSFDRLARELGTVANVQVAGLDDYSLDDVDIFIGKKMSADKLKSANRLKAVFAYKTGVDDFPLLELDKMGVALYNSHINSTYIAQYAFGLGASLVNRIVEFDRKMRGGDWQQNGPYWKSIFTMKAGLVGYGNIGREIHKILLANGIESYTLDRGKKYENINLVPNLEELCHKTDILFLSLPKTNEVAKMFDKRIFDLLEDKYIVNVGRSSCIDEDALYDALTQGGLAGAAIDTWREKPKSAGQLLLPFDRPFHTLDNIILSSHKAMQVSDGHDKYIMDTLDNVLCYIGGGTPRNRVNLELGY